MAAVTLVKNQVDKLASEREEMQDELEVLRLRKEYLLSKEKDPVRQERLQRRLERKLEESDRAQVDPLGVRREKWEKKNRAMKEVMRHNFLGGGNESFLNPLCDRELAKELQGPASARRPSPLKTSIPSLPRLNTPRRAFVHR
jgi:hypothetical protein